MLDLNVIKKRNDGTYDDNHTEVAVGGPTLCLAIGDVSFLLKEVERLQKQRDFHKEHAAMWKKIAYQALESIDIGEAIDHILGLEDMAQ